MQQQKRSDNAFLFLTIWFVIPLALVLLIEALDLPEHFMRWMGRLW